MILLRESVLLVLFCGNSIKLLIILAVVLTTASAFNLRGEETNSSRREEPVVKKEGGITNGETASEGLFPYQVGLSLKKGISAIWCGGSLIGNEWVLTAAHCVDGPHSAVVHLGALYRKKSEVSFKVSADDFIIHPEWDYEMKLNYIALINIPSVSLSSTIQVIELPPLVSSYSSYDGEYAIASGWGRTSDNSKASPKELQYARLQIISNSQCKKVYRRSFTKNNICVATEGGVSVCSGDSGGPLVLESDNILIGVTSYGAKEGCTLDFPAAFVRLTSYVDWIYSHTGIAY